jgi:hypothetical protein
MTALYIHKPERVYGSNLKAGAIAEQVAACTPKKRFKRAGNILRKTGNLGVNKEITSGIF